MNDKVTFSIHTLGCKVNQYEGERIVAGLLQLGWEQVDFAAQSDVYIINSCTVTSVASHKSRQLIRRAIRRNPEALVVVAGCYAASDRPEIEKITGVGLVVSNEEKNDLPRILAERLGRVELLATPIEIAHVGAHTRALVKVQDGCVQFCSYCIVPHVRGELWTRPEAEIIDEVSKLTASGTREIVLTGIHLGLYGAGTNTNLGELLSKLVEIPNLGRLRLSSLEMREVSPQIIDLVADSGKLCRHLHVPLQSGSTNVLERMNRHYTAAEFVERAQEWRRRIPDLGITTDIIVGFPGETELDFAESVRVVEQVRFSKLHVFKFSPRKGTPAATFEDQIPSAVKDERSAQLITIGNEFADEFAAQQIGKTLDVLVERRVGNFLSGVSDNYIRVYCEGPDEAIGSLLKVAIEKQEDATLYGKIV